MPTKTRILLLLTSVWFIAAAAVGTRLAFAYNQQRKIPHQILATVPFEQETGNIALALSQGEGFSNLFRQHTGPTAWIPPVYPFLLSLIFRVLGPFTLSSFFAAVFINALFSAATTFPLFHLAQKVAGRTVAIITAWFWVALPAGIMMPFEWIWDTSLSVFSRSNTFCGRDPPYFRICKTLALAGLRTALGHRSSHQSITRHCAAVSAAFGLRFVRATSVPTLLARSQSRAPLVVVPVLPSLDHSQLRSFPPHNSRSLQLSFRTLDWQQRHL